MIDRKMMNKVVNDWIDNWQVVTRSSGETTHYEKLVLDCMGISLILIQQMAIDINNIRNAVVKEQGEPQMSKRADYLAEMERREHERGKDVQRA